MRRKSVWISILAFLCGCCFVIGGCSALGNGKTDASVSSSESASQEASLICEVKFHSINGTPVQAQKVAVGEKLNEEATSSTRGGYTLIGWCTSRAEAENLTGTPWDFDGQTVTQDMTLYAMWQMEEYQLTLLAPEGSGYTLVAKNAEGKVLQDGATITVADAITFSLSVETGYIPGEIIVSSAEKRYTWQGNTLSNVREDVTVSATVKEIEKKSIEETVDFVVEVERGRDIRVLQLTDTQIIDAAQARPGREGVDVVNWATDKMDDRLYDYMREIIPAYDPDLIILTGDLVYGEFDDNGTSLLDLIRVMDSFEIPWAPVFGNHDNESAKGVDWQCRQLEQSPYCLFKQGDLTGNGNYSVGVVQGGQLVRVFYMLDSHGCLRSAGFADDQIQWYTDAVNELKAFYPQTKASLAFHIQMQIWSDALAANGAVSGGTLDLDKDDDDTTHGYMGKPLKSPWDFSYTVWNGIKELGIIDSMFVGHEHSNNTSLVYEGIRLCYGLKTGTYDRANYVTSSGTIEASYNPYHGKPIIGATAVEFNGAGALNTYHIYNL